MNQDYGYSSSKYMHTSTTYASEKDMHKTKNFMGSKLDFMNTMNGSSVERNIKTSSSSKRKEDFLNRNYEPFMQKRQYNLDLNENMNEIKKTTRKDAFSTYFLARKNNEVKKIAHDLIIYNNPSKILSLSLLNSYKSEYT